MTQPLTSAAGWRLQLPPGWPAPPEGWTPPPGWSPDPAWPKPPRGWAVWHPDEPVAIDQQPAHVNKDLTWAEPLGAPAVGEGRRTLRVEIWVLLSVFPLPALVTAVVLLLRSVLEGTEPDQIDQVFHQHDVLSSAFGGVLYLASTGSVAVALYLLWSSGISLRSLGLRRDGLWRDARNAAGIVAVGYAILFVVGLITEPFGGLPGSVTPDHPHLPAIFILQGVIISIGTAVVEETGINAYLLTRFGQLGWTPRKALWVSMAVRTSYHAYYGVGLVLTVPVGYLLTRSFQKHRRLLRCVMAHALYDALLFTLTILVS